MGRDDAVPSAPAAESMAAVSQEPWLDKRAVAEHFSCSIRSLQTALKEGMPHAVIFGKVKCRLSEVEPWLEAHGHLERRAGGRKLAAETEAGRRRGNAPAPDTRS